ncbi:hypothetical protein NBRC111894_1187 [Sporolactobacillus inulinus]|uniref:Uncharacterized protein n=1 Tax=Sporolactobacillus inulinus TaxID=2078 RepID=A0A4Y1Z9L8_9BACL|nr:hypothetical protein NBRC111894_1187 [Sporolactobacillus inulinus]
MFLFLQFMIWTLLQTNRPVSWPRIKAEVLWRLRDRALLMRASKTPQIPACLRRLLDARGRTLLMRAAEVSFKHIADE